MTEATKVSRPNESKEYNEKALRDRLAAAKNIFAGAPLGVTGGAICLPPDTELTITPKSLAVRNPICQIAFTVELSGGSSNVRPGSGGQMPTLGNGEPRYETRWIGMTVETTFFALRAQSLHAKKYRAWCERVVRGVRGWFEES